MKERETENGCHVVWLRSKGSKEDSLKALSKVYLELLLLGDLRAEQLVVEHLELELDRIAASLHQMVRTGGTDGGNGTCFSCSSSSWRD